MATTGTKLIHDTTTNAILGAFHHVYNILGHGFAEVVYENALAIVFREAFLQQVPIEIFFKGQLVGRYVADMIVDGKVAQAGQLFLHATSRDRAI